MKPLIWDLHIKKKKRKENEDQRSRRKVWVETKLKTDPGPVGLYSLLQSLPPWFSHDPKGRFTEYNDLVNLSCTLESSREIFNMPFSKPN